MRWPRLRFTIGGMMVVVLLAGLALWGESALRSLQSPTVSEQLADANYKQALLTREVAEYALKEYVEGVAKQEQADLDGQMAMAMAKSDLDRAIERSYRSNMPIIGGSEPVNSDRLEVLNEYRREKTIKELTSEIHKARADEQAKLEAYRVERSRRWRRILGL